MARFPGWARYVHPPGGRLGQPGHHLDGSGFYSPVGTNESEQLARSHSQRYIVRGQSYERTSVFHLPEKLPEGTYDLRIAMVDDTGNPAIRLGIEGGDERKRYSLGTISIVRDAGRT